MIGSPNFKIEDHLTWRKLFSQQTLRRKQQMTPEFIEGLRILEIDEAEIPDLQRINRKLRSLSGWQGIYTEGFVEAIDFFKMMSQRKFPIGNFIRDSKDLSYTPAPDVFHDLYGHIPFYTVPAYGDFCQKIGEMALKYIHVPQAICEFQSLFWFAIEFALVKNQQGIQIFGAGIASSFSECAYALSDRPRIHAFDINVIRDKRFKIDVFQEDLFLLSSPEQLYTCLDDFEKNIHRPSST